MKIKPVIRKLLAPGSRFVNRMVMPAHWPQNVSIVFYHTIEPEPPVFTKGAFNVKTPEAFERDLELLLKTMKPASVEDLFRSSIAKRKFLITFDDGLKGCYEYVMPLLYKKGIEAVFFVNPAFVDNKAMFYRFKANLIAETLKASERAPKNATNNKTKHLANIINEKSPIQTSPAELLKWLAQANFAENNLLDELARELDLDFAEYLEKNEPYMSMEQLSALSARGFTIGAHSMHHPLYTDIEFSEQVLETVQSMKWIGEHFIQRRALFAFPFTADGVRPLVMEVVQMLAHVDAFFGTSGYHYKGEILQRIDLENSSLPADKLLEFEWLYARLKHLTGR